MSVRTIGAAERRVEARRTRVAGPVAVGADHDAVGVHEVVDRGALLEELGVGRRSRAALPARERRRIERPVPTGTVLFITSACSVESPAARRSRPRRARGRRRRSRSAACRRRRTAGARARARRAMSVVKCRRSAFAVDQLGQAGLVDRHLAARERRRPCRASMSRAPDLVAELGEAGGGDQADPADADDPDGLLVRHHEAEQAYLAAPARASGRWPASRLSESVCSRVLEIQYAALVVCQADQPQAVAVVEAARTCARRSSRSSDGVARGSAGPARSCPARRSTRRAARA